MQKKRFSPLTGCESPAKRVQNALILIGPAADKRPDQGIGGHQVRVDGAEELKARYTFTRENAGNILKAEVGKVFARVLEHAGVYRRSPEGAEAFLRFIDAVNREGRQG